MTAASRFPVRESAERRAASRNRIEFKAFRLRQFRTCYLAYRNKPSMKEVCHATLPKKSPSRCWSDSGDFHPCRRRKVATAHRRYRTGANPQARSRGTAGTEEDGPRPLRRLQLKQCPAIVGGFDQSNRSRTDERF